MNSVDPTQLGRKILADLNVEPGQAFTYSKLRSRAILIEPEAEAPGAQAGIQT